MILKRSRSSTRRCRSAPLSQRSRRSSDRSELIDLEILERHLNAELLFDLSQEFHERERVHQAGIDQVRFERRDLRVQLLREQGGDLLR